MQDAGYWPLNFIHPFFPSCMGSSLLARNLFRDETPRDSGRQQNPRPLFHVPCTVLRPPSPRKQQNVDETLTSLRRLGITANGRPCHIGSAEQRKAFIDAAIKVSAGLGVTMPTGHCNPSTAELILPCSGVRPHRHPRVQRGGEPDGRPHRRHPR